MYVSASRRAPEQVDSVVDTSPAATTTTTSVGAVGPRFPIGPGWVVHLPIMVSNLASAVSLAEEMAAWLACVPQIDAGAVEVSAEDLQSRRIRVLCQRRITGDRRCWLPRKHEGECRDGQPRPQRRTHNDVARRWVNAIET
jgi:hypothetical protein